MIIKIYKNKKQKKFSIRKFPEWEYVMKQYRKSWYQRGHFEALLITFKKRKIWIFASREVYNGWPSSSG